MNATITFFYTQIQEHSKALSVYRLGRSGAALGAQINPTLLGMFETRAVEAADGIVAMLKRKV